jgi:CBS domain-containing protein
MATAEQLIAIKGTAVASLPSTATVLEAAQLMNDRHIGSVLVIDQDHLVGIFTERDVMRRIVAEERSAATTQLDDVMTRQVACAALHTRLDEIRAVMRRRRIRHIPVLEGRRVMGMISIGDLNKADHDGQVETIKYLEQFMSVT